MADQIAENNMNFRIIDVNNNVADNNAGLNNAGTAGHNVVPTANMPGPSDYRDGATASSSSIPQRLEDDRSPPQHYQPIQFHEVSVFAGADTTIRALFAAINQINYPIFAQGERLRVLEDARRAPRRHMRPQSPLPRQEEERPRSPPRRHSQDISRSPSPRSVGRRPALERAQPVDPRRCDHVPSRQERRPPGDRNWGNNERPYRPRNAPRDQGHHDRQHIRSPSRSPDRSDEDDPRSPLSQAIIEASIPPGMEKPPT
ncbi:unnamed protein product [Vicia faba]|uniref:Uncharacterized protein n=1 Tax=Vicia faba TaxID=3906 RepID=A0AAV0ZCD6_VICFA|nr:unnamed protein product [Vicia faba]